MYTLHIVFYRKKSNYYKRKLNKSFTKKVSTNNLNVQQQN